GGADVEEFGLLELACRYGQLAAARFLMLEAGATAASTGDDVLTEFEGKGFGDFKPALTDLAVSQLGPIGSEMTRLMSDSAEIDRILQDGARRADAIAQPIIAEVKEIVGFLAR
ncbi:MAG: hypothetical protein VX394_05820, partial [Pseudomonadota bacterium]|nr:hypothetical protein [Pseudomonadota bacterium]